MEIVVWFSFVLLGMTVAALAALVPSGAIAHSPEWAIVATVFAVQTASAVWVWRLLRARRIASRNAKEGDA